MLAGESRCPQGFLCFISRLSSGNAQDKCRLVPCSCCCSYAKTIVPTPMYSLTWIQEVKLHNLQKKIPAFRDMTTAHRLPAVAIAVT
ncbi:Os05g0200601 [Oryza sativa Japonica Group]|uniref:Os05g0200601 protein n=1 Tax=Oryza sativa subsp. japonica TaxID=39947 RepID=A0A0P0WJ67_ORYSJ|nr:hypothetical protein EE612_027714 [Oryza sativa]BAS92712.1 Os05g0200601 [Oryza sativa Japonica Group]